MAAIKKSQSKRSENHMMETRRLARKSAQPTKRKPEETDEKKDGDNEVPPSRENECGSDGECDVSVTARGRLVRWYNARYVCAGWFHLECSRMKEGVGVLDGRAFVCCFCLSAKVLELTKLVGELQGEMI